MEKKDKKMAEEIAGAYVDLSGFYKKDEFMSDSQEWRTKSKKKTKPPKQPLKAAKAAKLPIAFTAPTNPKNTKQTQKPVELSEEEAMKRAIEESLKENITESSFFPVSF
jgi:hypothetical protein